MPDSPYIVEVGSVQQDELSHLRQILQAAVARLLLICESFIKTLKGLLVPNMKLAQETGLRRVPICLAILGFQKRARIWGFCKLGIPSWGFFVATRTVVFCGLYSCSLFSGPSPMSCTSEWECLLAENSQGSITFFFVFLFFTRPRKLPG